MRVASTFAAASAALTIIALLRWRRRQKQRVAFYSGGPLDLAALPDNPYALLRTWMTEAIAYEGFAAKCMVVATCSPEEGPTARTVICQSVEAQPERGGYLLFGSNPTSLKGRQLSADPRAEAVFRWGQRQVRVRGTVEVQPNERACFRALPRGARLGLTFLEQGKSVSEAEHAASLRRYASLAEADSPADAIEQPANYAAFVLRPVTFEFYAGGHPGYVNDRLLYLNEEKASSCWRVQRLQG